ncbi:MAG: hypothetical protein QXP84_07440 [Candidatus Korarchaeum sp.]
MGNTKFRRRIRRAKSGSWQGVLPNPLPEKWNLEEEKTYSWIWEPIGFRKAIVEVVEDEGS